MKAKIYIGILSAVLLPGFLAQAQIADARDFRNEGAGLVINNYYNDYDYFYTSRINRFHRSFSAFNYYSPVFTDSYWYNYEPYTWGLSIYGGGGLGFGNSFNYPVYYNYGWNEPYFGSSYYWGYDPFFFGGWYSPVVVNIRIRNRWSHNYYGWNGRNRWDRWDYHNRPVYNTYNNNNYNYPSGNYPSNTNISRRGESVNSNNPAVNASRRESTNRSNNPADVRINRRQEQTPVRNQSTNENTVRSNTRSQNVNTNTSRPVNRPETTAAPSRRSAVSSGNNRGSGRAATAPSRSSASSVKSGSATTKNSGTSRSSSKSTSSKTSKEKTRRK
jgi:hypothetical protein